MIGFAAMMGLAVLAPLAASADDCRREVVVRPRYEKVKVEYRHEVHDWDRDRRDRREPVREERVRYQHDRRDCR